MSPFQGSYQLRWLRVGLTLAVDTSILAMAAVVDCDGIGRAVSKATLSSCASYLIQINEASSSTKSGITKGISIYRENRTKLQQIKLITAKLQQTKLITAKLQQIKLITAKLQQIKLITAKLQQIKLITAYLIIMSDASMFTHDTSN